MKIRRRQIIGLVAVALVAMFGWNKFTHNKKSDQTIKIVNAHIGAIRKIVSTTGTVLPKNRLEIKPPVNGRIEQVLIKEGQAVKTGDIVAWMSSTDRAALLDAARGQGEDKLKYWTDVYKPIPLIAPIDGDVIVGTIQPGQAVTTSDPVIVLSDRLIVRGQVDETDIGKIKEGQKATVSLDAYPEAKIDAVVDHIYYESKTVNNVTIYSVDLTPEKVPPFFRSGMNANIDFIQESKENILMLPANAIQHVKGETFVMVKNGSGKPTKRPIKIGISDDKNVEIVEGVTEEDDVVLTTQKYRLPQNAGGTNPFAPQRRRSSS